MKRRTLLSGGLFGVLLLLLFGATFLPLYDCPLCELYKAPRWSRDCVCNTNSMANLWQFLAARRKVAEEADYGEGQGAVTVKGMPDAREFMTKPQTAWETLLEAMREGREDRLKELTTAKGLDCLKDGGQKGSISPQDWSRWATSWKRWEIRWISSGSTDTAEAAVGPTGKEHHFIFIKTKGTWKLDQWLPGD